ncbi:muramidase [Sphingomonas sp.]|uniref:muramidase n=1 Tax=Sphingomonas sp. TaxID=28214 RepID=UPI0025D52508|nr:muramidase [Sphingomonas sp.]
MLTAKAIQLCAAASAVAAGPLPAPYAIAVRTGPTLVRQPATAADAEATVRDLISLGADFTAGPLEVNGRDFSTYGITPTSVFDPCLLAHPADRASPETTGVATISGVTALLRQAFAARITDTIRPMNATYGARYSWHKYGQAIDFVPAAGVGAIDRAQIRSLMALHGIRLVELLGPGDRGHSNHWHLAFARPGQMIDQTRPIEEAEDWVLTVADAAPAPAVGDVQAERVPILAQQAAPAPAPWDVFATADWRAAHGGGS